jgi:hypothetical protein
MGNCKSTSAINFGVGNAKAHDILKSAEKGVGASTDTGITEASKPLLQVLINGNVEAAAIAPSPTADLSEANSMDSQSTPWGEQKEEEEEEEEEEENTEEEEKVDGEADNDSADEHVLPPPPGAPTTTDSELEAKSDVAPAFSLLLPFVSGNIPNPTSMLQIASDYGLISSVVPGGEKTNMSAWALDPTTIVTGAVATLLGDNDDELQRQEAPSDEESVNHEAEVKEEVDPVIVSYKQKASQWAIDDAMKGSTKRRGPRPEDCDFSSARRKSKRPVASAER